MGTSYEKSVTSGNIRGSDGVSPMRDNVLFPFLATGEEFSPPVVS